MPLASRVVLGGCLTLLAACQPSSPPSGEGPAVPPAPAPAASRFLERAQQVVVGHAHSCALVAGGAVYCWGEGSQGQLGRGSWDDSAVPVRVAGVDQATAIVGGTAHICALLSSGKVMCWGGDHLDGAGDGSQRARMQPAFVPDLDGAVELTAADVTTCARRRDGSVACWGQNLARRPHGPGPDTHHLATRMDGLLDVQRIVAGSHHLCAIQGADRALVCLGLGSELDDPGTYQDPVVVLRSGWTGVDAVATGGATCFRNNGGKTWRCWGRTTRAADAAVAPGSERVQAFTLGWEGGCSTDQNGALSCWKEAGTGPGTPIQGIGPVRSVAFYGARELGHTCAVDQRGAVLCWGHNGSGKLGDGSTSDRPQPVRVLAPASTARVPLRAGPTPTGQRFTGADEIAAGYHETCARRGGEVWCWGEWHGRTVTDPLRIRTRPERIDGLPAKAVEIAAGFGYMCARLVTGRVWCWGANDRGQLGDGTRQRHHVPVAVKGLGDATALALAYGRGCALRAGNQFSCWSGVDPPADLAALASRRGQIAEIATGGGHTCARLRSGQVLCQGANDHGQIGNGEGGCVPDPTDLSCSRPRVVCKPRQICAKSDAFVPVIGLEDAIGLSLGSSTTCALRAGGRVSCWGNGMHGRLGIGEPVPAIVKTPTEIPGLVDVKSLVSDDSHTCAVLADGRLLCWGQNVWGELGDRTKQTRPSPWPVSGITDAVEVGAGISHTCARRADRSVWCWGNNDGGILGVGIHEDISRLSTPHPVRN